MIFAIAVSSTFCNFPSKFQVSAIFGSWDMTLFFRSCHGPNGRFTLSCAISVSGTYEYITDAVFTVVCKLHLSCVKNVMRHYNRVNCSGQGQFNSTIVLPWPEVKFLTWPSEVKKYMLRCVLERREKHYGAQINPLSFLVQKLFAKNGTTQNCYLFYFDPTCRGQDMT